MLKESKNHNMILQFIYTLIVIGILNLAMPIQGVSLNNSDFTDSYQYGSGLIDKEGQDHIRTLITLLEDMGLDVSYGDDGGNIFSMVDQSLNQIITDLSSGNSEGITEIPLIQETMKYLGVNLNEVIINPENISGPMKAVERYEKNNSNN